MATEAVENYLKAIHTLASESPSDEAGLGKVAALLGVTAGTATSMIRKLAAGGLVKYQRYGGVRLTAKGSAVAIDVLRRHRLIETFLVQTLQFDWSEVHEEAERLEHAVSPKLLSRLEAFLGSPKVDPHGDPIPSARGVLPVPEGVSMTVAAGGEGGKGGKGGMGGDGGGKGRFRVLRVTDQGPAFLKFIADQRLKPGTVGLRLRSDASAGLVHATQGRDVTTLAMAVADRIIVVREG